MRLPGCCRSEETEVIIHRDREVLDVIPSGRPGDWDGFFAALQGIAIPEDFLSERGRDQGSQDRDPFTGWHE
ncbi:MAG: antitoxin [Acetobacteraceae bacterium]